MNTKLVIIFIILNIVNVILQTVKSIATVKCGKTMAALVNAIAYGLYTVVLVYTVCELPLMLKAIVVAVCNLVGVWVVKFFEEKARKDKLWKVEATVDKEFADDLHIFLLEGGIPHNYIPNIGEWVLFNCYCKSQNDSALVKELLEAAGAKFFVSESKTL